MNVLFDTNAVLDALLDREPWADAAVVLFDRVESGDVVGHLGATTVTTIHYIARRNVSVGRLRQAQGHAARRDRAVARILSYDPKQ